MNTPTAIHENNKNKAEEKDASIKDLDYSKLTPAMAQYVEIKREHSDYLLFYRMGDFYELFFEDAITVAGALGLTLTSRSKIDDKNIPMCGVPFHAYELHLERLIKLGYKVAICEQVETPEEAKKREGSKAVVKREVVRLITSGTLTEDTLLQAKSNNFIVSCCVRSSEIGLAWIDISTGSFFMQNLPIEKKRAVSILSSALARLSPAELLIEDKLLEYPEYFSLFAEYKEKLAVRPRALFNVDSAINTLMRAYKVKTLDAFGDFSKIELIASGVLLEYIENTQRGKLPRLENPHRVLSEDILEIDGATRRSLELTKPNSDSGVCLLKVIDRTVTAMGGRMLSDRLSSPIMDIKEINDRLDMISFFIEHNKIRKEIRNQLRKCQDLKRSIQRLSLNRGGPRDLYDLATTLHLIPYIKDIILSFSSYQESNMYAQAPASLLELTQKFFDHSALEEEILRVLLDNREEMPALARNGGFIKDGVYAPLDYLRNIRKDAKDKTEELKEKYSQEMGVQVKIKDNTLIGYFIEVPTKYADKFFEDKRFIHRQTVLNAVRFTTVELSELNSDVNSSEEKALELEIKIFNELTDRIIAQCDAISRSAEILAALDIASSLAELSIEYNYCRPIIDDSNDLEIIEGRHPVVEAVMKKDATGSFIGNNCNLKKDEDTIWLLTGPNMAGKSTFLRQNALIIILAQMGSYVPAKSAKIGIVDKVFSRVGASDELARGRSTFMVEMVETAAILNQATNKSFVILDEIGRGTATFDGLSIAWAVVEQLAEINKCRTLFATHYHELIKLNTRINALSLHCMKIKEFDGDVIFMHEVIEGSADRSYGIHVARLAGLPDLTVKRAEQVLKLLEEEKQNKILSSIEDDLPLFEVLRETAIKETPNPIIEDIKNIDVDSLSPREALDKLYELKSKLI